MTDKTLITTWDFDSSSINGPANETIKKGRENWVFDYFGENVPWFIWRIEFFEYPSGDPDPSERYSMVLHRFASDSVTGRRYHTWVKAYNERGDAVTTRLAAAAEPASYALEALPPRNLLLGNFENFVTA